MRYELPEIVGSHSYPSSDEFCSGRDVAVSATRSSVAVAPEVGACEL